MDCLIASGEAIQVIDYLNTKPNAAELRSIIKKLNIKPEELIRKKEPVFKNLFDEKVLTDEEAIQAMVDYPELIERPIIIAGDKARIARDADSINEILQLT